MKPLGRLLTAMVTPFNQDGLDISQTKALVKRLLKDSDGVVAAGTTGESPTLSHAEKLELFRVVREACPQEKTFVAGTGSNDTSASIQMTQEAESLGADAVLVVNPYYNKPSQEGLYQHFRAIAQSTSLPVILYNHPGRTGVSIAPETLTRLMEFDNIVAVKDSSGSLETITQFRQAGRPGFMVYSGDDPLFLPTMAAGGYGLISVASHVIGAEMKQLLNHALAGKYDAALEIHERYFELFKALFMAPSPAPTKAALAMTGFPVGGVRLPLVDLGPADSDKLRTLLSRLELPLEV